MKYQKSSAVSGAWLKSNTIREKTKARIVSECMPQPSAYTNKDGSPKMQNVAKVKFETLPEALNVNINRSSLNALIDAFGDDSVKWQGNTLTVIPIRAQVSGKMQTMLYFVPEGYELQETEEGFINISKVGQEPSVGEYGQPNE